MSRVCELWTVSRLLWAVVSLTTIFEGWLRQSGSSPVLKSLLLVPVTVISSLGSSTLKVLIFALLEILPIVLAIRELQHILENEDEFLLEEQPLLGRPQYSYLQGGTWEEAQEQCFATSGPLSPERLKGDLYLRILEDFGSPLRPNNGNGAARPPGGQRSRGLKLAFSKPKYTGVNSASPRNG